MASRLQIDEDSDWTCLRLGERQYFWNDETDEKMLALTEGVKIREVDNLVQTDAEMVQDFEADWAELQAAAGADTSAATAEWVEGQKLHPTASVRRSVGQQVKVKSTSGQWRDTTIVESKDGRVRVHYDGFDSKYDEWLKTDSERVDWGRVTGDAEEAKLRDEALASLSVLDSAAAEGGAKGGEEGEEGEPERPPLTASEQARENWVVTEACSRALPLSLHALRRLLFPADFSFSPSSLSLSFRSSSAASFFGLLTGRAARTHGRHAGDGVRAAEGERGEREGAQRHDGHGAPVLGGGAGDGGEGAVRAHQAGRV